MFLLWLWYMMSWTGAVVMARLCWRDTRAMCGQGGLAFIPDQIRDRDRGTARSEKGARYRTGNYEHEAAWWAMRDTRIRRPLEISNKPIQGGQKRAGFFGSYRDEDEHAQTF